MADEVTTAVWIGSFAKEKEFIKYTGREKGHSQFEKDFGLPGHLNEEYGFSTPAVSVKELLGELMCSMAYADRASDAAKARGILTGTSAIVAGVAAPHWDDGDKIDIKTLKNIDSPMVFVGAFDHLDSALSIAEAEGHEPQGLADHSGYVSVWLGTVADRKAWHEYLHEQYEEDAEPISKFGGDFSLSWYDHDFLECIRRSKECAVLTLVKQCSHGHTFAEAVADAAGKKRMTKANAIIVIYDFAFDQPGAEFTEAAHREGKKIKSKSLVKFVGTFPFSRDE